MRTIKFKLNQSDDLSFYRKIVDIYTIAKGIKRLSPTEMEVMVYLCKYGFEEGEELIIEHKVVASKQQFRNIRTQLISWGLVLNDKRKKKYSVVDHLIYPEERMGFVIAVGVHKEVKLSDEE